ncbi:AAA family ATPase [Aerosakkonema sp. BLCC-F183]|uniref:AAA family ATPase n=1 Tax=Aerosakkonema sp. BLCC-F183 TaxID=3342834 RepID=UPI0035BB9149
MTPFIEILSSYVPAHTLRRAEANPTPLTAPVLERFPAAVLFADISGFTALAEKLTQRSPAGVEELTKHLNAYFGQLIASIASSGGDVIKFAGDALLAIWPTTDEPLDTVTHRAAQCSLAILTELNDYRADDVCLSLHIGMAAGEIIGLHVGGVKGRWEFLIAGEPLVQMASAEAHAKQGEVCISPEGWALIQDKFEGTILESGDVRLEAVREPLLPRRTEVPMVLPEMVAALRGYIPFGVLERLDAGQTQWLAELRNVSVLFVQAKGIDYTDVEVLDLLQQAMQAMQRCVYRYGGTIRQLIVDDKGSVLIAAFGLPPFAHEDNAVRAVQAAVAIRDNLWELGLPSSIGITTGWVYCGKVGSDARCEYAMVGDVVNLAARLMVKAFDRVWCDRATYQAARGRLYFETCPPIQVKGKAEPVPVYRPLDLMQLTDSSQMPVVGRIQERQLLLGKLRALLKGASGVMVLEGEPGIGKSRLLNYLCSRARRVGVTVLVGAGDEIEKSTPYYAWRSVFSQLFGLEALTDLQARRDRVMAFFSSQEHLLPFYPLLDAILPLELPENEITAQMSAKVRADNTCQLLVQLLQKSVKESPVLLILDDAQWLDSISWLLLLAVIQQVGPLLLVMATRPVTGTKPLEYDRLLQMPNTEYLRLEPLPPEDSLALVCQRLGVTTLPSAAAKLIGDKAEGNPFFSEELAYALRDAGSIVIVDGECRLATDVENFNTFTWPDTVAGVITSRIDRLTPLQALTLKVASAIGRVFAFRILRDIYPIEADKEHLADYLYTLEKLDITLPETPQPNLAYIFKHIITQEVTYNTMLFSQRRQLHYAVAQWYEQNYGDDLSLFYPVLAHHYSLGVNIGHSRTKEVSKAIDYLEKAGEQALANYANQEAVRFFKDALALHDRTESSSSKLLCPLRYSMRNGSDGESAFYLRPARWERQLGEAYLGLGQLAESREHLKRSLVLLGYPMPRHGAFLVTHLLCQFLQQATHRLGFLRFQSSSLGLQTILLETARVLDLLAEVYYHANETVASVYATMHNLNVAERAGPSTELARAYANSCFAATVMALHSLAQEYSDRARSIAQSQERAMADEARVSIVISVYSISVGHWDRVRDDLTRAREICERLGDRHHWGYCLTIMAKAAYFQGNFNLGIELWAEVYAAARQRGDILQQAWGLNGQAEGLLRLFEVDKAVRLLEESLKLFAQTVDRVSVPATYGVLAMARLLRGEEQLAREAVLATQELLIQLPLPNSYYFIEGYAGVAQVYLALWENSCSRGAKDELKALKESACRACKALNKFARAFPIAQPRGWLCQGLYDWLTGHHARARSSWHKSLAVAEKLAMPYEQGLAHYEIGRHATGFDRQKHLKSASELFTRLGAAFDLARVRAALAKDETFDPLAIALD